MKSNECNLCCLVSSVYCLNCFRSGFCDGLDMFRPKTEHNLNIMERIQKGRESD